MEMVTVITPHILGREAELERCKASVAAQTYPGVEHHIYLDEEKKGPAYARNMAFHDVDTEWISFLDDDDDMLPNHIETHMKYADDRDVIFSWGEVVHLDGGTAVFDSCYDPDKILAGHNTIPVTATVRSDLFRAVNGFSETERFEDWHLWKKLILHKARFHCIEEVTWHYNIAPDTRNSKE